MVNEFKTILMDDGKKLAIIALIGLAFFKIHYYNESIVTLVGLLILHFYLFVLPGYALTLGYHKRLEFPERFVIGLGIGYGVQPLLLYLINVVTAINILQYNKIVSLAMILVGLGIFYWTSKSH